MKTHLSFRFCSFFSSDNSDAYLESCCLLMSRWFNWHPRHSLAAAIRLYLSWRRHCLSNRDMIQCLTDHVFWTFQDFSWRFMRHYLHDVLLFWSPLVRKILSACPGWSVELLSRLHLSQPWWIITSSLLKPWVSWIPWRSQQRPSLSSRFAGRCQTISPSSIFSGTNRCSSIQCPFWDICHRVFICSNWVYSYVILESSLSQPFLSWEKS